VISRQKMYFVYRNYIFCGLQHT